MKTKIKEQYYLMWVGFCADYYFSMFTFKIKFQSNFTVNIKNFVEVCTTCV